MTSGRRLGLKCIFAIGILILAELRGVCQTVEPKAVTLAAPPSRANFRLERLPIANGAELLTIFGTPPGDSETGEAAKELPLISLFRDTLGDGNKENDRLRYLWVFSYTRPSLFQTATASVPFLYGRTGNKKNATGVPSPIIDLSSPHDHAWQRFVWNGIQSFVLDQQGVAIKASTRTVRQNAENYRKAHIARGLAILSLFQTETGSVLLSEDERRDVQARLMLSDNNFSFLIDDVYLNSVYTKQTSKTLDVRGHNWELLRQRAESEGLYFEPLKVPDGGDTHAVLWVAREDLASGQRRQFNSRFLNIANPWTDSRLRKWAGYSEVWNFDSENRRVAAGIPGTRAVEMIPLAVYGFDHPHVPILLIDFRDTINPKLREAYRRATNDVLHGIYSVSRFGDFRFFIARSIFNLVTSRRGADINQPSRFRSYAQLKLLLSVGGESLSPELRAEIGRRIETVSLNPMENDVSREIEMARQQYDALREYAVRPDGLAKRLELDRGAEVTPFVHTGTERAMLRTANILSLGFYKHREKVTPELLARLEVKRTMQFHERFLREVVKSSPQIDVNWDLEPVRSSLRFISDNTAAAGANTARLAAQIFARTVDEETRRLCLVSLYRIDRETAKSALLRLYQDDSLDVRWRVECAEYLRSALREQQRIAPSDAKEIARIEF
ncbi:MAG TPA: hypothetical protein VFV34_19445 [Blastocatellia bacterium]|nr:hypothetical protein [Blastocatellia bacterium]